MNPARGFGWWLWTAGCSRAIRRRGLVALSCALLLTGCLDLGDQAVRHDSPEAQQQLLADETKRVEFDPPAEERPDLLSEYRLAHGDVVSIALVGRSDTRRPVTRIDPDGTVSYLMLRGIPAAGHTVGELQAEVTRQIAPYFRNAEAYVVPQQLTGHTIYLLGTIQRPGPLPYDRPLRLLDAMALGGGFRRGFAGGLARPVVDLERSMVVRRGKMVPTDFKALVQEGDLRWNLLLQPGDQVVFASFVDAQVDVLGAVNNPGPVAYTPGLGLVGVLAQAGGPAERAYRSTICVLRGNLNKPDLYTFDLDLLLVGRTTDFAIKPGDIVYVPDRPFNYARELALQGLNTFVSTIGSFAGADLFRELTEPIDPR